MELYRNYGIRLSYNEAAVIEENTGGWVRIPVHPDRYSGNYTDSVPEVSGHESEGMRTVIRRYPDTRNQF